MLGALVVLAVAAGGVGYAYLILSQTLGVHVPNSEERPSDRSLPYESVTFTARDGTKLSAWYIVPPQPKAAAVIIPGFEETAGGKSEPFVLAVMEALYKNGFASLALDPRSYGESEGEKITLGIKEWMDAEAGYDYLRARPELAEKKIGFIGDSMGGTIAIAAAARSGKGDFVVASAPVENYGVAFGKWVEADGLPTIATYFVRAAALPFLGFDYWRYDSEDLIDRIHVPILLIGPTHDEQVGTDQVRLFARANEPKLLVTPKGATHTLVDEMPELYHAELIAFLHTVIGQ